MNPIAIALGLGGAGFAAYKAFRKPGKEDFQVQRVVGANNIPVKVVTPIPRVTSRPQQTTVPVAPPVQIPFRAVPHVVQTTSSKPPTTVYAPPAAITQTGPGQYEMAPIIVTPSGASSVAIGSIVDIQRALNTLGFQPILKDDGVLGPKTVANIRAFQAKNGLAVDGNAGPATKAALSSALTGMASGGTGAKVATAQAKVPAPPITANMSNRDVQHALNVLGTSPPLKEDGAIGPKSVAAIKSFQLSHGLTTDGIAGPKTKAALYTAVSQAGVHGDDDMGQFSGTWA